MKWKAGHVRQYDEWVEWFAWHPVKIDEWWVWLETIERAQLSPPDIYGSPIRLLVHPLYVAPWSYRLLQLRKWPAPPEKVSDG